jgi:hypothetical protein
VPWDLSSIGGLKNDRVWQGIVQELDIETGKVLFEWHSIEKGNSQKLNFAFHDFYEVGPPLYGVLRSW